MNDDFYIGWEDKAPQSHRRTTRLFVLAAVTVALLSGLGLAASQRLIGVAFFEWGNVREFTGVLRAEPYPHLVLPVNGTNLTSIAAPLVAPFKFGVKHEAICGFDGLKVKLRATRIHRDQQLMLEVEPGSVMLAGEPSQDVAGAPSITRQLHSTQPSDARRSVSSGRYTLRGEIVDSKCWMGVMNPGVLTPHRACAVRCISGGIPPMLLVRRENAPPLSLLLVSTNDQPVNAAVLAFVAEPVEITGEMVKHGELLTFRIEPAAIRRLTSDTHQAAGNSRAP